MTTPSEPPPSTWPPVLLTVFVLPWAGVVAWAAAVTAPAVGVQAEFDVEDFFSPDTDFVAGLDLLDLHVGDRGGEPAILYVEGPLTDPTALARLSDRIDEIAELDTDVFARRDGVVFVEGGVFGEFDQVLASPAALGLIASVTGSRTRPSRSAPSTRSHPSRQVVLVG